MTAQFPDEFLLEGQAYTLAGINGGPLFEPQTVGLNPLPTCTACWRGYVCIYSLDHDQFILTELQVAHGKLVTGSRPFELRPGPIINGVAPQPHPGSNSVFNNLYQNLNLPIPFDGGLLLADGFIRELYVHMGFHPAWKYRTVIELIFETGRLNEQRNVSDEVALLREKMTSQPMEPGTKADRSDIEAWVEATFRRNYFLPHVRHH